MSHGNTTPSLISSLLTIVNVFDVHFDIIAVRYGGIRRRHMRILRGLGACVSISFFPIDYQILTQRASPKQIKEKDIDGDEDDVPNKDKCCRRSQEKIWPVLHRTEAYHRPTKY